MTPARNAIAFSAYELVAAAFAELSISGARVFVRRVPGRPDPPYAVIHLSETPSFVQAKDKTFSEVRVEVQSYARTGSEVDAIASVVVEQFRDNRLTPPGFRVLSQEIENRFPVALESADSPVIEGEVVVCRVRVQPN